jgi:hypothetical protein
MITNNETPLDASHRLTAEILYAPNPHLDALVLVCASSHALDVFDTVPRTLFTSPNGQSGKSTALDIIMLLGNNPWKSTGATSFALRAKFNEPERPFVVADEISDVFGTSGRGGGRNNPIALIARDGYRRTATLSLAVDRSAEDVSSFCFLAMAGLKTAVPADIRTRCIVFPMAPKPSGIKMARESTDTDTEEEAKSYRESLHSYVRSLIPRIKRIKRSFVSPHPLFTDRKQQVWISLMLVAMASDEYETERREELGLPPREGPSWTSRCLTAFKALALDASDMPALLPAQKMLRDVAALFISTGADKLFASDILDMLRDESGEPLWDNLTDRRMALLMTEALGESQVFTISGRRARGFHAKPAVQAWDKMEESLLPKAVPASEDEASLFDDIPRHSTHSTDSNLKEDA